MGSHDNGNGSRKYLADAVSAQATRLDALGGRVADIDSRVAGQTVALATLIESERRAGASRDKMWAELNAIRGEQQQIAISQSALPGAIERLAAALESLRKKQEEIDVDRQQAKGGFKLIMAAGVGALVTAAAWIWKVFFAAPPAPPPAWHP